MNTLFNNGVGDNDGNNAGNWDNGLPVAGKVAVFDHNTTDDNCTFSGDISCDGIRFDNSYAGTVDANGHNITLGTEGLDVSGWTGVVNCGGGKWSCSGDWKNNCATSMLLMAISQLDDDELAQVLAQVLRHLAG